MLKMNKIIGIVSLIGLIGTISSVGAMHKLTGSDFYIASRRADGKLEGMYADKDGFYTGLVLDEASNSGSITGPKMTVDGISLAGKKIVKVADGSADSDAVNFGQLKRYVASNGGNVNINDIVNSPIFNAKLGEVNAMSAALSALHPLGYDGENKWEISAGYGHAKVGKDVLAIGAFYHANEDNMLSIGATLVDNYAYNIGYTTRFGKDKNKKSITKDDRIKKLEKENREIKEELENLKQMIFEMKK